MKKILYLSLAAFLLMNFSMNAQFLKKLKKKVEQKVEETVTKNVSDKAASETDKSLDKVWEKKLANGKMPVGAQMVPKSEIPKTYDFNWEVTMEIETRGEKMEMIYLIKEGAPYLGIKVTGAQNVITVMDNKKDITAMYMNSGGQKYVTGTRIEKNPEDQEKFDENTGMEFREIGSKSIMGYHSKGYQSENEDHVYTFYVTEEAEINFTDLYKNDQKNMPKDFNPDWLKNQTGFLMQMQIRDKRKPKNNVTMTCTSIKKQNFTIRTTDYEGLPGQ